MSNQPTKATKSNKAPTPAMCIHKVPHSKAEVRTKCLKDLASMKWRKKKFCILCIFLVFFNIIWMAPTNVFLIGEDKKKYRRKKMGTCSFDSQTHKLEWKCVLFGVLELFLWVSAFLEEKNYFWSLFLWGWASDA